MAVSVLGNVLNSSGGDCDLLLVNVWKTARVGQNGDKKTDRRHSVIATQCCRQLKILHCVPIVHFFMSFSYVGHFLEALKHFQIMKTISDHQ